jgi:hypothetical protein
VQGRAQPKRTGPDDDDVGVHQASVPQFPSAAAHPAISPALLIKAPGLPRQSE